MSDLQRLWKIQIISMGLGNLLRIWEAYLETCVEPEPSGKGTSSLRMLAKVALRFLPLKGVVPKSIS